jgi:hypothetical protein
MALRGLLTNPLLFDADTITKVRGPASQFVNDELHVISARLTGCPGRLDATAYTALSDVYRAPWILSVPAYFTLEVVDTDATLVANDICSTDAQKFMSFANVFHSNATVQRQLKLFEDINPDDDQRIWPRLKAYMMGQAKILPVERV